MKASEFSEFVSSTFRVAFLLLFTLCLPASSQRVFTTVDPPGSTRTEVVDINNAGKIVGTYTSSAGTHGFLLSGGVYTTIDVPQATYTASTGLNDAGQIVGYFAGQDGRRHGYLLSGSNFTTFDFPSAVNTQVWGINNAGQIVGNWEDGTTSHGFKFSGGLYSNIDVPNSNYAQAAKINTSGQIIGFHYNLSAFTSVHGFTLTNGVFTSFDVSSGANTYAQDLDDNGHTVGFVDFFAYNNRGFTLAGTTSAFIDFPGAARTLASGTNNTGQIVGSYDSGGNVIHGFLANPPEPTYNVCALYDSSKAVKSGATIPLKLQLCDGSGVNRSAPNIVLHATSVMLANTSIGSTAQDSGNANPDSDFRYDSAIGVTGGYIFNLSTKGLASGTYVLTFTAGGGTTIYQAPFQVK